MMKSNSNITWCSVKYTSLGLQSHKAMRQQASAFQHMQASELLLICPYTATPSSLLQAVIVSGTQSFMLLVCARHNILQLFTDNLEHNIFVWKCAH